MINKKPKIEVGTVLLCTKAPTSYEGYYTKGKEYTVEAVRRTYINGFAQTVYDVRSGTDRIDEWSEELLSHYCFNRSSKSPIHFKIKTYGPKKSFGNGVFALGLITLGLICDTLVRHLLG
jgi:hypothetical protein